MSKGNKKRKNCKNSNYKKNPVVVANKETV